MLDGQIVLNICMYGPHMFKTYYVSDLKSLRLNRFVWLCLPPAVVDISSCFCSGQGTLYIFLNIWKEMFYLTTHSTHFIYCYIASDIW